MKYTERIVHLLRTNPDADITALVEEDASTLTAKVVATTRIPLIRLAVIEFVRAVHLATAHVLRREHQRRVVAEMDAADFRARLNAANRRLRRASTLFEYLKNAPREDSEIPEMIEEITKLLKPVMSPEKPGATP